MIVRFVWDSLRGELKEEGGEAHSQTKLAENGKPFRLFFFLYTFSVALSFQTAAYFVRNCCGLIHLRLLLVSFPSLFSLCHPVAITPTTQKALWYH